MIGFGRYQEAVNKTEFDLGLAQGDHQNRLVEVAGDDVVLLG